MHRSTYNQLKLSLWSLVYRGLAFLTVKLLQYNQVRIIVLSIYNDTVTPGMKINSLYCFMIHPSTPYYSGTPFKNFGTPLGVQYTLLKSTGLKIYHSTGIFSEPEKISSHLIFLSIAPLFLDLPMTVL